MFKKSKNSVSNPDKQSGKATFVDIMAAANRQFSSMGFNKVTMEEIAHEAGLGKASLYYYFPDKDSLFYAVLLEEYNQLEAGIKEILAKDVVASVKLKQYVEVRFQYFNRLLNLNVMEQKNSGRLKPILTKMFVEFRQQELSLLVRVFREGKDSGEFRLASAGKTAEAFLHTMSGLRMRFLHHSTATIINSAEFAKLKKEINLVVDIFIRGISV